MSNVRIYNLQGIREAAYASLGWGPKASDEARERVDGFISRAYYDMAMDIPFVFFEDEKTVQLYPDFQARPIEDDIIRLAPVSTLRDPWCLEFKTPLPAPHEAFQEAVGGTMGGTLSGRKILLQHPDTERWHERTIRDVFTADIQGNIYLRFTVEEPLVEDVEFKNWRVRRGGFNIPKDVLEIKGVAPLVGDKFRWIELVGSGGRPQVTQEPPLITTVGFPALAYRKEYRALQAPTFQPELSTPQGVIGQEPNPDWPNTPGAPQFIPVIGDLPWVGPEAEGRFQYCFTFGYGRHEGWAREISPPTQGAMLGDLGDNTLDRGQPWLESPPSKLSDLSSGGSTAIQVSLPNMAAVLGFDDSGTPRWRRTGLVKRIYRRRITDTTATLETPDRFYLIDEVEDHVTSWVDDGTLVPDYESPLRPAHGYQTLEFYPTPGEPMDILLRYVRFPVPLTDPQDVPRVHEAAVSLIVDLAVAYVHESQGNHGVAQYHRNRYEEGRKTLSARFGSARPKSLPTGHARARVRNRRTSRHLVSTPYKD